MADLAPERPTGAAPAHQDSGEVQEYLAFYLAGELYGLRLRRIREILNPPPITPIPRAGGSIVGVCSVRGLLVTVVDLRRLLKLEQRPLGPRARVLLLEADSGELLGLLVDEVSNVLRLSPAQLELSSGVFGGDLSEQIAGIGRPDGHTVMILLELGPLLSR